ncbi:MAG TPA: bifunctional phosphoglucose/phosphomannose isomerase [Nitrososphaera sp.]|nr:bifunctional phosphoglucose/phosphomannose isomerase [Nitrososphaera sp.]HKX82323.1 bifunctional phosphoglucose/phosphomannose isomerase [Nitrososphaera sp.]
MTTVPLKEENVTMMQKVMDFPSQLASAFDLVRNDLTDLTRPQGRISRVVVAGMGASGVVGDFVRVLMRESRVPIHVQKSTNLPAFVDGETLVLSITYSGKTRETLEILHASIGAGARNLVITSSFELGDFCSRNAIPWIRVPENGFPRATLGFMLISALGALNKLGLTGSFDSDVEETISVLDEIKSQCGPEVLQKNNPARLLAQSLVGRFPVIYGESGFTEVIAVRWKQQMNENGKSHCYYDVFPELLHNEIESWNSSDSAQAREYALLLLRDSGWEHQAKMESKVEATKQLAESKGAIVYDLWTKGRSELAKLLSLCYVGDFVSVYLATSRNIDPGPVRNIEQLKKVSLTSME